MSWLNKKDEAQQPQFTVNPTTGLPIDQQGAIAVAVEEAAPLPIKKRRGRPFKKKAEPLGERAARVTRDDQVSTDETRKLDHFQYSKDPKDLQWWEGDKTLSPMHVPDGLREKRPDLAFKYLSKARIDRLGAGYHGWEIYKDNKHPLGIGRGNDLILGCKPEEDAEKYRRFVSESSSKAVRGMQEAQFNRVEAGIDMGRDAVPEADGGTAIGVRPKVGKGGGYRRGYDPEQVREIIAKNRERMNKHRKIFA